MLGYHTICGKQFRETEDERSVVAAFREWTRPFGFAWETRVNAVRQRVFSIQLPMIQGMAQLSDLSVIEGGMTASAEVLTA